MLFDIKQLFFTMQGDTVLQKVYAGRTYLKSRRHAARGPLVDNPYCNLNSRKRPVYDTAKRDMFGQRGSSHHTGLILSAGFLRVEDYISTKYLSSENVLRRMNRKNTQLPHSDSPNVQFLSAKIVTFPLKVQSRV